MRALAILPVVLNHSGLRGFSGGYVGVDVFFVISGFLITSILARDIALGRYSTAEFYRRRVLRIFPALFAVLAAVTVVGCIVMMPSELSSYGLSLIATALNLSNVLFYSEAGYFDTAAQVKPLLHTWSLAIEEQFYIIWPLLLAAIGVRRRTLIAVVAGITLASLAFSVWLIGRDASATFYLLPTRAWELGIGGLIAIMGVRVRWRWLNELMGAVGLVLILYAIWAYDDQTTFPGLAALAPCLGAGLLIVSGASGTLVSRLMSNTIAVFVGRISFSLYLWHWPVIVFAKIGLLWPSTQAVGIATVAVSLGLATLSWRFVEEPLRGPIALGWKTSHVLLGAAAAIALTVMIGVALIATNGLAWRYTPTQTAIAAYSDRDEEASYRRGSCFIIKEADTLDRDACLTPSGGKPTILLLGDSQAAHLWPGLAKLSDQYDVLQATTVGCRPVIPSESDRQRCAAFFREMLTTWVPANSPDLIILSGRWIVADVEPLKATVLNLRGQRLNVVVVGPVPRYDVALPRLLVMAARQGDPRLPIKSYDPTGFEADEQLSSTMDGISATYLSPIKLLCHQDLCDGLAEAGVPMQFDNSHLSVAGSERLVGLMKNDLDKALLSMH